MNITSTGVAVALAVVLALGLLLFGPQVLTFFFNSGNVASTEQPLQDAGAQPTGEVQNNQPTMPSELPKTLTVTDVVVGTGAEAKPGDSVSLTYVGMLPDGTVFDASANHGGAPFTFKLGSGQVIKGWDQGIVGMKVGGKRQLIIPPDMAYGDRAVGDVIPANSTLIFQVELVKIGQ